LESSDLATAGSASRELLTRWEECAPHLDRVIDRLALPNHALANDARLILERMEARCIPHLLARFAATTGELRLEYLRLLAMHVDLPTLFDLLPRELNSDDPVTRFSAARSIVYRLYSKTGMDSASRALVDESLALMVASVTDRSPLYFAAHTRMALKHCGKIPRESN
jgi:hypothetical protein